jgi:hypothetical protein
MHQINMLRANLIWDPKQLDTIYSLYGQCVLRGISFPLEIEEHSLLLLLKFVRPDDDRAATQLISVLKQLDKPVPEELKKLASKSHVVSMAKMAANARERQDRRSARNGSVAPLHQRLIFVAALPKSASRLLVSTLAAMHPNERYRMQAILPYSTGFVGIDATADLRHDVLENYSGGGIVHTHLSATSATRHALAHLGLGHVITVRHPADHVAAHYCHIRALAFVSDEFQRLAEAEPLTNHFASDSQYEHDEEPSRLYFHDIIFPVDNRFFAPTVELDDTIAHMIADGYLYHALSWIVGWQIKRIRNISAIVRYEDMVGNPENTLRRLNSRIYQSDSEDALTRGLNVMRERVYEPSADPAAYPRGPTGSKGIWRQYLSRRNRELYNKECKRFLAGHPYGALVKTLYDDLLISTDD